MLRKRAIVSHKIKQSLNLNVIELAENENPAKRGTGPPTQTTLVTVTITLSQRNFVNSIKQKLRPTETIVQQTVERFSILRNPLKVRRATGALGIMTSRI